ncbi:MAG: orotate phosphoribosyltransferase [Pseudomonadota bacterium]|nr:orotate phosphoribosyltransferase [Pseudomonadota bacterium]
MHDYQTAFLELALKHGVLKFGQFTLKSGRVSPYFFNLGQISSGAAMRRLGQAYAQSLAASGLAFDGLFGPAYKGIPLVTSVALALAEAGRDVPYAYNRKEAKDHGEGGTLVGGPPKGRIVIVDDVLTAGTALREAVAMLRTAGAEPVGALIALDRQEKGASGRSAVQEMEHDSGIRVVPLVTVQTLMDYLSRNSVVDASVIDSIREYQARYCI